MAKGEVSGIVTAFRQSKFKQDSYQTIVDLAKPDHAGELLGARVVWARKDGVQILGRVVALHGRKGALRVRWDRGFPPQAPRTQAAAHTEANEEHDRAARFGASLAKGGRSQPDPPLVWFGETIFERRS